MDDSVAIVQRILPHYRVPFFDLLNKELSAKGIRLVLYYGQERPGTVPRTVQLDKPWAKRLNNRYIAIGNTELVWQPCLSGLRNFDLIIVEQASRLLINHALLFSRHWSRKKLAFWGHGRNRQAGVHGRWREGLKRRLVGGVDWWFAYTEATSDYLIHEGFPPARITTVNNTIDASGLRRAMKLVDAQSVSAIKTRFEMDSGPVGLYCGGLYPEKRIDFLLDTCRAIKDRLPNFQMLIIGEGPDGAAVRSAADAFDWLHYVGPVYGDERAPYLKIADVLLMPGAVGLVMIDSFVAEIPLITTDVDTHGPEIAYLEPGVNGVITRNSVASYAEAVVDALAEERLWLLRKGCRKSAALYSIQRMAKKYAEGIVDCLDH